MRIMLVTADREVLSLIEEESKIKRFDLVTVLPSEQWWNLQREGLDSSVDPILIDLAIAAPGTRKEWATLRASWPDSRIIGFTRRMDDDLIESAFAVGLSGLIHLDEHEWNKNTFSGKQLARVKPEFITNARH